MDQKTNYLNIISIFHYVVAGIAGLFACFPIFHLAMGLTMLTGDFFTPEVGAEIPFPFSLFGLMFTVIPAAMILLGWAFAVALGVSGYFLSQRRNYLYCLVMAGVSCLFMPFGTVLGVFTIVLLTQEEYKAEFTSSDDMVNADSEDY